ncbi:hypothetical protein CLAFUW4_01374 [Fulvia fulva]|uniref:Uncharacterized protein n=1 Tax=Passalora fulva TaxID=5499 RepID=A0A9Q8L6J8_PASFU|nr:uncharacterized protein CLAFUR5_01377 [Fulvia fulva]KAK4634663.1 hypothetical protein CLAFUR4_01375 [Fulvia fulva]KAK4637065.1 hypothetical protein CLAFUR0_01376 [Fulvia fulva]UJO11726.1 hypothetical protein CLAFUR5_01377 [Fulvia fulva]WPV09047.1 hypothetical protein CLAFUW4_01374 [Fulvia fulva]WPV24306.1 hypothetical protein CLAFUW7_01379 [Fulvia fulva]
MIEENDVTEKFRDVVGMDKDALLDSWETDLHPPDISVTQRTNDTSNPLHDRLVSMRAKLFLE